MEVGGYGVTINGELLDIKPLLRDKMIKVVDECKAKDYIWAIQAEVCLRRIINEKKGS